MQWLIVLLAAGIAWFFLASMSREESDREVRRTVETLNHQQKERDTLRYQPLRTPERSVRYSSAHGGEQLHMTQDEEMLMHTDESGPNLDVGAAAWNRRHDHGALHDNDRVDVGAYGDSQYDQGSYPMDEQHPYGQSPYASEFEQNTVGSLGNAMYPSVDVTGMSGDVLGSSTGAYGRETNEWDSKIVDRAIYERQYVNQIAHPYDDNLNEQLMSGVDPAQTGFITGSTGPQEYGLRNEAHHRQEVNRRNDELRHRDGDRRFDDHRYREVRGNSFVPKNDVPYESYKDALQHNGHSFFETPDTIRPIPQSLTDVPSGLEDSNWTPGPAGSTNVFAGTNPNSYNDFNIATGGAMMFSPMFQIDALRMEQVNAEDIPYLDGALQYADNFDPRTGGPTPYKEAEERARREAHRGRDDDDPPTWSPS